jgi:hypothetical protein
MISRETLDQQDHQGVTEAILLALKGICYGSVEIVVHDSKVVQIERKEKTRFDSTFLRPNPLDSR